jgi:predicted nucleotide-binding protein (sugar kinase/HSP70/actin superfamily)
MYWKYGQRILGSTFFIKTHPQLHAIYLTNFGCGPDSFIAHFFREKLQDHPHLTLEIDEHSADTGALTRIEAFIDSLKNVAKQHQGAQSPTVFSRSKLDKRTLYIPLMSDHAFALSAAFTACGVDTQVIPESDEETLQLGRKYTSGRECYPCILTTGDIIKIVQSPGFDPSRSAFFMPSGRGPCRFGLYNRFHKLVLEELGYGDVPVFAPVQDETLYENFDGYSKDFSRLAWIGVVAVDLLSKKLRETRPYELRPGTSDEVYQEFLHKVCSCIKGREDILSVLKEARIAFDDISIDRNMMKPLIGLVGEIYIRANRFGNEDLVRKIEKLGAEVWLAPISEWILYTNYTAKKACFEKKNYSQFFKLLLKDVFQRRLEHKLEEVFKGSLRNYGEPSTELILKHAQPYLDVSFEGEAILSIGKALDFTLRGASGIITAMPFTCMPGTIVNSILKQCREDFQAFPVLNIAYDGQQDTNTGVRLETFIHQVREYQR